MDKRHRKLNIELNEEFAERKIHFHDYEQFLDAVIKKAEKNENTFASPKENRQTQTPEQTTKRKYPFVIFTNDLDPN